MKNWIVKTFCLLLFANVVSAKAAAPKKEFELKVPMNVTKLESVHIYVGASLIQLRAVAELYDIYPSITIQASSKKEEGVAPRVLFEKDIRESDGFPSMRDAQGTIRKMDWELPKSDSETTQKAKLHLSGYGYQCDLGMTVTEAAVTLDAVKCNLVDPKP